MSERYEIRVKREEDIKEREKECEGFFCKCMMGACKWLFTPPNDIGFWETHLLRGAHTRKEYEEDGAGGVWKGVR